MSNKNKAGDIIRLEGVSLLGKNRIREHGPLWKVSKDTGTMMLMESIRTGYWKWMEKEEDKDFKEV